MTDEPQAPVLPYTDSKPQGAADFYFAINATFRFILRRLGKDGLRAYWSDMGTHYYAPVSAQWKRDGVAGVADYLEAFFGAEPGAEVVVRRRPDETLLEVRVCPAIRHLRAAGREIVPCFCQHCYYVNATIAAPAGLAVRVEGGNGACRQRFFRPAPDEPSQDMDAIREIS